MTRRMSDRFIEGMAPTDDPVAVDAGVVARADAVMDAIGASYGAPDPAEWRDEETGMAVEARDAIALALHRAGEEMRERAAAEAAKRVVGIESAAAIRALPLGD